MDSVIPTLSTKADFERLRADMRRGQSEMRAWMIGTALTMVLAVSSLGVLIGNNV